MTQPASTSAPRLFANLDEVVHYLEQLQTNGYQSLGKWNLAQVAEHLSDWLEYMLDGYPKSSPLVQPLIWIVRVTMGKRLLRKILATGKMASGGPTLPQTVHDAAGLNDAQSLDRFRKTVERFQQWSGEYQASPLFGTLTAEEGQRLQLIHCAHHANFLSPRTGELK